MKKRLTETVADRARPPAGKKEVFIRDSELPGFGLRVGATGNSFIYECFKDGKSRRVTIGQYPAWTAKEAREDARRRRQSIDRGEVVDTHTKTLADAWKRFWENHAPALRPRTRADYERRWQLQIAPAFGNKRLSAITFGDVEALHLSMSDRPFDANRTHALIRMLFNRAKRWQWIDRNPAMGVETYPEPPREEYLSLTEVELIFQHLPDNVYGDIIRVLMQTGARPCEVYEMRWADLDLAELRWTKPASGTKQKKTHHTVLSAPVAEIIARQPKASPFVFINPQGKQINKVDSTWKRTLEQAGVKHHRLYAVRHTVASMLASAGVDLYTIGKHLGHSHPSTTARYAHMHEEALRRTADIVAFPTKKAG